MAVRQRRVGLGIANFLLQKPRILPLNWTDEMDAMLGARSDGALARTFGSSTSAVYSRRKKLGIAPFEEKSTET